MTAARLLNVCMRGGALALRFVLLFALARVLPPAEVGLYGLFSAIVLYVASVAGLGYSMYSAREVAAAEANRRTPIIRDQAVFCTIAYALVLPVCFLLLAAGIIPWSLAGWFFGLLVLEHIGVETERLLVASSRQTFASAVLFLRNGAWVAVAVPLMWTHAGARSLETVLLSWVIGAAAASALGLAGVARIGAWDLSRPVDWRSMRVGLRVGLPLLAGTVALRGLTTIDRVWVKAIEGLEVLAPYVLFVGVAGVVKAFLNSSVFPFCYPGLVRAAAVGDPAEFARRMRSMYLQTAAVTTLSIAVSMALIGPLLDWIDRPIYSRHLDFFYLAQLAIALYAAGQAAQSGIYALRMDRRIVVGQVAGLAVFGAAAAALAPYAGATGVLIALCVAYASMLSINLRGFAGNPVHARVPR